MCDPIHHPLLYLVLFISFCLICSPFSFCSFVLLSPETATKQRLSIDKAMEVAYREWPDKFQALLSHISNAHFVALDFELSGISMKKFVRKGYAPPPQRQTLQQRYEEVKAAAEKYQILQLGITTVVEDERTGTYVVRPYNIHVTPVIQPGLGIDRTFSFLSSSVAFLLNHGFDFQTSLAHGVPYLSRSEEASARALEQQSKNRFPLDPRASGFRASNFESKLQHQVGLRYLIEAMVAGDSLDNVELPSWPDSAGVTRWDPDLKGNIARFEAIKQKLRKPTVLVGHNLFVDLVNLYSCFIGQLPDHVRDFTREIHKLFPFIIDTKNLATHLNHGQSGFLSLQELNKSLNDLPLPKIDCHLHHSRYTSSEQYFHEAGYDSGITAQVAIRLSARLGALGNHPTQPLEQEVEVKGSELRAQEGQPSKPKTALEELEDVFGAPAKNQPFTIPMRGTFPGSTSLPYEEPPRIETLKYMPHFESGFWRIYGNRLQVNGTTEENLVLGEWSAQGLKDHNKE